ncbi:MAG: hypothetical protein H5T49_00585 [Hadesarchaea archaeon]|nr:hypothetical protein [Hadesarchaea archaeon]
MSHREACPQCGGTKFVQDHDRGELICTSCGFIVQERIVDTGPDWRAFEGEKKKHTGPPISETLHDRGISSMVGWDDSDARGKGLSPESRAKFRRLRKWDQRLENHDRSLIRALQVQKTICYNLGLPRYINERAALLYRKATKKTFRGYPAECVAVAAVYLACREFSIRRDLKEFASACGASLEKLRNAYLELAKHFPLRPPPVSPMSVMNNIAAKLGISETVKQRVLERLKTAEAVTEKEALKMISAAIYEASDRSVTQEEIARAVSLSRVSILKVVSK